MPNSKSKSSDFSDTTILEESIVISLHCELDLIISLRHERGRYRPQDRSQGRKSLFYYMLNLEKPYGLDILRK